MAMITDPEYVLQAIRLSALRSSGDPLAPRIISLDPSFSLNPYINASGLSDLDRWPEIKRALDSPPPDLDGYSSDDRPRPRRRAASGDGDERPVGRGGSGSMGELGNKTGRSGLNYTQTIMGGKSGGLGMRVTGRASRDKKEGRANSSSAAATTPHSPTNDKTPRNPRIPAMDGFFSPSTRPRADSAPAPNVPEIRQPSSLAVGSSMLTSGRGMGVSNMDAVGGILEHALSVSETSGDIFEDGEEDLTGEYSRGGFDNGDIGQSARPGDLSIDAGGIIGRLGGGMVDEGSDVDEEDIEEEEGEFDDDTRELPEPDATQPAPSRGSHSLDGSEISEKIDFKPVAIGRPSPAGFSALTAALNKHIPHLVSTSSANAGQGETIANPFMSLYTSVAAPSTSIPSVTLELYFPHSSNETVPLVVKVRRDATVEEVTGYGLFKYWEEGRKPLLQDEESDQRWSTVGWGLRIVEDDGEVDEDFPPLDRDSQIAKFSYGQFAIVEATDTQIRQNTAKAPLIQRRPSRIIAPPIRTKPSIQGKPSFGQPDQASTSTDQQSSQQQNRPPQQSRSTSTTSLSSTEMLPPPHLGSSALKGSVGLSSALSKTVLLKVRVTASADVRFTTTISAPSDMYIADLTEVLCRKKRLQGSSADWVLCLADLTLALPLDRTVASLEGRIDLALVRRQWAVEHGLRIGDRRGGDPSASIFKRMSEPAPLAKFGAGMTDISQAYKKYRVQRKIAIGRHERVLAIDGDYIHIMPSESRAFFDSMKTTSFHVSLVASCKLTGRAGGFKINVWREGNQKRYEFEAENGRQAAEIISSIRQLMKSYQAERNSTVLAPRAPKR